MILMLIFKLYSILVLGYTLSSCWKKYMFEGDEDSKYPIILLLPVFLYVLVSNII